MSHFSDTRPSSGQDSQAAMFALPADPQKKKQAVSNLTKNLMSSSARYVPPHIDPTSAEPPRQPPLYSASVSSHKNFIPVNLFGSRPAIPNLTSFNSREFYPPPTGSTGTLFTGNNANYIPLGHNTPTAVSSSYTSNYSRTPSFSSAMAQSSSQVNSNTLQNPNPNQQQFGLHSGPLPGSFKATAMPTTTISMDSANPNISLHDQYLLATVAAIPTPVNARPESFERHLSNSFVSNGGENGRPIHPAAMHRNDSGQGHAHNYYIHHNHPTQQQQQQSPVPDQSQSLGLAQNQNGLQNQFYQDRASGSSNAQIEHSNISAHSYVNSSADFFNSEPDHYMSYKEYLDLLNRRDATSAGTNNEVYEEHFNIVDYSVDELITMLACLLTKIIDTNDKLHPNHFDNTIAARQKLKEQRKLKKMESERRAAASAAEVSVTYSNDGISTTVSHISDADNSDNSSDEEEDELKNRYLANVLAFHGTNVPGISLHAYLTRVLKYCPVTNEVFLSLLVYFDRIAKRANNLKKKKKESEAEGEEPEQLFVMDSYNIHRLIILGITVSSKFFSDIFYKNLRYAKVGGLPLEELNYLELQFLLLLDFKLMISVEDLQNYGDLLLKFWKREQLANEITKQDAVNKPDAHMGD